MPIVSPATTYTAEHLFIDPTDENTGLQLDIMADPYGLATLDAPAPRVQAVMAGSIDTEGETPDATKHDNAPVTIAVDIVSASRSARDAAVAALQAKIAKIAREGGTLRKVIADGSYRTADLLPADVTYEPRFDVMYDGGLGATVQIGLLRKPYVRAVEQSFGTFTETTSPALVFTVAHIPGDVSALGRLVTSDTQAKDQWWLVHGYQSRYYDAAASAALFYEAETRTAMGGSAAAAGPAGASGAGSNVIRNTSLSTSYQAILSTQASGGGAHLSHIGTYRVYARAQVPVTNAGAVTVALEWGAGDFRRSTLNAGWDLDPAWEGTWRIIPLGLVTIAKVTQGAQQWEGRILAKSTAAGDDIDIDLLFLVPADEGSGVASGIPQLRTPSVFTGRDEFDQTAGNLVGKVAPVGGTWANLSGPATDFATTGSGTVTRATTSDASARIDLLGTTTPTDTVVQVDFSFSVRSSATTAGVVARVVDANNYLTAIINDPLNNGYLEIRKIVAGVGTNLATWQYPATFNDTAVSTLRLYVDAVGRVFVWLSQAANLGEPILIAQDADLATGGVLASGKIGIVDANTVGTANTRTYDNFLAFAPTADAAIFASQSLEIAHNGTTRKDPTGAIWTEISSYVGDSLRVPPAGPEDRTVRFIVKASRNDPATMPDSGIDDISAVLYLTPRYLTFN